MWNIWIVCGTYLTDYVTIEWMQHRYIHMSNLFTSLYLFHTTVNQHNGWSPFWLVILPATSIAWKPSKARKLTHKLIGDKSSGKIWHRFQLKPDFRTTTLLKKQKTPPLIRKKFFSKLIRILGHKRMQVDSRPATSVKFS